MNLNETNFFRLRYRLRIDNKILGSIHDLQPRIIGSPTVGGIEKVLRSGRARRMPWPPDCVQGGGGGFIVADHDPTASIDKDDNRLGTAPYAAWCTFVSAVRRRVREAVECVGHNRHLRIGRVVEARDVGISAFTSNQRVATRSTGAVNDVIRGVRRKRRTRDDKNVFTG